MNPTWLPIATLVANIGGCFAIGALAQWSLHHDIGKEWWVVGVRVGLLGGLTTFSSFALDVARLWNDSNRSLSAGLAASHLVLGLLAVAAGMICMQLESQRVAE